MMKRTIMGAMSTYRRNTYPSHGKLLKETIVKVEMGAQVAKRTLKVLCTTGLNTQKLGPPGEAERSFLQEKGW